MFGSGATPFWFSGVSHRIHVKNKRWQEGLGSPKSVCHPRADDSHCGVGEFVNVAGGEHRPVAPTRGSNLGIGWADGSAVSLAANDDVSVVSSCRLIERRDSVFEILGQQRFDTFGKVDLSLTVRKPSDSVEQFGNCDRREIDLGRGLAVNPIKDGSRRLEPHEFGHDVRVEDYHGSVAPRGRSVRAGKSRSTPPIVANRWWTRLPSRSCDGGLVNASRRISRTSASIERSRSAALTRKRTRSSSSKSRMASRGRVSRVFGCGATRSCG